VPFNAPAGLGVDQYSDLLAETLVKAVAPWAAWKGVVGFSLTRNVVKAMGYLNDEGTLPAVLSLLLQRHGIQASFVHTMDLTEAAGYAELGAGQFEAAETESREEWRGQVLVATLGANWGGVIFNDGHRIRQSGLSTMVTPDWAGSGSDLKQWGRLPRVGDPEWDEYIRLADDYIMNMVELTRPDHLVLMPTGAAATRPERLQPEAFLPLLTRTSAAAAAGGFTFGGSRSPEHAIVRGAALSALLELRLVRARKAVRKALEGAASVERLSPAQLRAVFDAFDTDGSGLLSSTEVAKGLDFLGLTNDASEAFAGEMAEGMTFEGFDQWWKKRIRNARVVSITSHEALGELVRKPMAEIPSGFGPLVLVEVTFSFCRACKAFARKYEVLAESHLDVRFVSLLANHNRETVDWVKSQDINKAPYFLLYRRGTDITSPIATWTGSSVSSCEAAIEQAQKGLAAAV